MKYRVAAPTSIQRATPTGLETFEFEAGEIEVGDDSDERFVLEYVGIPSGNVERIPTRKSSKTDTPEG